MCVAHRGRVAGVDHGDETVAKVADELVGGRKHDGVGAVALLLISWWRLVLVVVMNCRHYHRGWQAAAVIPIAGDYFPLLIIACTVVGRGEVPT